MYNSPSQNGGGWTPSGSQGSPASAKSPASQSLRPVTIAQIRKATQMHADADWVVDGNAMGQITVVAELHSHVAYTTNRTFGLDDGTARIDAKMWMDTPNDQLENTWRGLTVSNLPSVKFIPVYVRVTGSIKSHNNKRHIHASNVRIVTDPNEVYFHLLEVISVNVILQKGMSSSRPEQEQPVKTENGQSAYTIQSRPDQGQRMFSPMADRVVQYLQTGPRNPDGTFVGDIARALNCDGMELSTTVDKLIDDGFVFTTIDDSHIQLAA